MNILTKVVVAAAVLCSFASPLQAAEGFLMVEKTVTGTTTRTTQVQLERDRMRAELTGPAGDTLVVVFDGPQQVLRTISVDRKSYTEMTKADADRLAAQMQGAMAQMQAQLEKLPPAQRAQMEAALKGRGGAAAVPQYTRTGSDKVGRWACDKYDMTLNGQKLGEVCSVNPTALGFGATDFQVMGQMAAFYSAMAPQMPGQLPAVSGIDQGGSSGFPVKTVITVQGQTTTTEVVEAGRQTFADSLFAVPAGYTKQDMTGLMGGRGTQR